MQSARLVAALAELGSLGFPVRFHVHQSEDEQMTVYGKARHLLSGVILAIALPSNAQSPPVVGTANGLVQGTLRIHHDMRYRL